MIGAVGPMPRRTLGKGAGPRFRILRFGIRRFWIPRLRTPRLGTLHLALGLVALSIPGAAPLHAADDAASDTMAGSAHIAEMVGCFEVTYRFFEDGKHDFFSDKYGLDDPMTLENEITSRGPRSITITNYAITDRGRMPHWHMVWAYLENRDVWRQTIWGRAQGSSNREFRYTCEGRWEHNRWTCDAGRAPKPFRDDGAPFGFMRDDYTDLDRYNTILVTPEGWVMSQQNRKLTADGELVSYETGWILYEKQSEEACATGE